jgi:hypothetical protein
MWYTVEADKSTIRNEGETSAKVTYQTLRELFRLPTFNEDGRNQVAIIQESLRRIASKSPIAS